MVILREATIKYKGYDPSTLKSQSNKRICVSCNNCGRVRWVPYQAYRDLCGSCATKNRPDVSNKTREKLSKLNMSKNNSNYGKHPSDKTRRKMSESHKGSKHYLYGKFMSEETKEKIRNNVPNRKGKNNPMYGKRGEETGNWKGGIAGNRDHVLPINQCLHINKRFKGSEGHHILFDVIVYIPKELHRHLYHNFKSGQGIYEMNLLSLQYLRGWL